MNTQDITLSQKIGISTVTLPLLTAIPLSAKHLDIRLDVEAKAIALLKLETGVTWKGGRPDTNFANTEVDMIIPGSHYRYDATANTLTAIKK